MIPEDHRTSETLYSLPLKLLVIDVKLRPGLCLSRRTRIWRIQDIPAALFNQRLHIIAYCLVPEAMGFQHFAACQVVSAANAGVGLMLSGHTHGGQIWPFGYLIQLNYPFLKGKYEVPGMTIIVSRGTGT